MSFKGCIDNIIDIQNDVKARQTNITDQHNDITNQHNDITNQHNDITVQHEDITTQHHTIDNTAELIEYTHTDVTNKYNEIKSYVMPTEATYNKADMDTKFMRRDINQTTNTRLVTGSIGYKSSYNLPENQNLDNVDGITYASGFYDINVTNATTANVPELGWYYLEVQRHTNSNGFCKQILTRLNAANGIIVQWTRVQLGGTWGAWHKDWNDSVDGSGSGLDADKVDGLQASQFLRKDIDQTTSKSLGVGYFKTHKQAFNIGDGVVDIEQKDNYLRYRFGATGTPLGIRLDNYDTPAITLGRDGKIINTHQHLSRPTDSWSNATHLLINGLGGLYTNGGYDTTLFSNAYRNSAGKMSFLGAGGTTNKGSTITLSDQGDIFIEGGTYSGTGTRLPNIATFTASDKSLNIPKVTATTLRASNWTANSKTDGAIRLSGESGAIVIDSDGGKRIYWNDGGGNFGLRNGNYFNGSEKYTKAGDGAAEIELNSDSVDGNINLRVAPKSTNAEDDVNWTNSFSINNDKVVTTKGMTTGQKGITITRDGTPPQSLSLEESTTFTTSPSLVSRSADNNAKQMVYDSRTNDSLTTPTAGVLGHVFKVNGADKFLINDTDITANRNMNINGDVNFTGHGLISSGSGSNVDHIWHDDAKNVWHFCSDTSYKGQGSSNIKGGALTLTSASNSTNDRAGYTLNMTGRSWQSVGTGAADSTYSGAYIAGTISGSAVPTQDRVYRGLVIDLGDTTTGGNSTDKERSTRGLEVYTTTYGTASRTYGTQSYATAKNVNATVNEIKGFYSVARNYTSSTSNVSAMYGGMNLALSGKHTDGTSSNASYSFGGYNKSFTDSTYAGNIANSKGAYNEVEHNGTGTLASSIATQSVIDNNTTGGKITNGFLFRGSYEGELPTNAWGVYIDTDVSNYLKGNLRTDSYLRAGAGATNGFRFPDNAFGGSADSASITLQNPAGGETQELRIEVTNDGADLINLITPAPTGLKHNSNTIWSAGNDGSGSGLDADLLRGLPADFSVQKNANGYQKLPSGLIIQWGRLENRNDNVVVFPIAFPHVCANVQTMGYGYSGDYGQYNITVNPLKTQKGRFETYQSNSSVDITWIAIGY
jgi:hypothetical protein